MALLFWEYPAPRLRALSDRCQRPGLPKSQPLAARPPSLSLFVPRGGIFAPWQRFPGALVCRERAPEGTSVDAPRKVMDGAVFPARGLLCCCKSSALFYPG